MSASAIIPASGTEGLQLSIEKALALVNESKDLRELRDIRDEAGLLAGLARSRDASREVQNGAAELKLRAERKMGAILDEQKAAGARATGGKANLRRGASPATQLESPGAAAPPPASAPTLEQLGIDKNLARRTQAIAKMPDTKFETYIAAQKADPAGEITTAGALKVAASRNPHAASNVNNGDPEKNERFTPRALVVELHQELRFTRDFAGHPAAPATQVIGGRKRIWTAEDDCFTKDWTGERGLGNWPFDDLVKFVPFAFMKIVSGEGELVAQPMPATRTEQDFWQEFIEPFRPDRGGSGAEVRFLDGRTNYGNPQDPEGLDAGSAGFASAVVIFRGPFVRSPRVPLRGTIEEVIAAQRFGDDKGLAHLWKQALQLARGEVAPALAEDMVTYEWCQGSTQDPVHAFASESPETLSRCTKVRRSSMRMVNIRGAPPNICPVCRFEVDAEVRAGRSADGLLAKRRRSPSASPAPAAPGILLTLDQFRGELVDLGFSLSKRSGTAPAVAVRCTHRGCEEAFRVPFSKGTGMVDRAELKRLRQHSRSHAGGGAKKTKKRGKR